ncbi:MAG: hypothetical protein ACR2OJ_09330 [Hyphomicrobiales bacterium]
MTSETVTSTPVHSIDLTQVDAAWNFASENAEKITAFWQARRAELPALFNGAVLVTRGLDLTNGVLRGETIETDFASFYAWLWWGCPDKSVYNLFSSAVIMGADGALVFGKMASQTANAGRVYPPGGSLDLNDIRPDGTVDLLGSVSRELFEETGLVEENAEEGSLSLHRSGQKCSLARVFQFAEDADAIALMIRAFLQSQGEPELIDVVVIRNADEMPVSVMPDWSQSICHHALNA